MATNPFQLLKLLVRSGRYSGKGIRSIARLGGYLQDRSRLTRSLQDHAMSGAWAMGKDRPYLFDRDANNGLMNAHYLKQDLFVAQLVYGKNPKRHLDVGSRVDGFLTHLCTSRSVDVADIRKLDSSIDNLNYVQANFMDEIPASMVAAYDSVSCLHALEHFGLGRYGDPIDALGHLKGFAMLSKALTSGGTLYVSVPIGPQRIEFNAQRVFSPRTVLDMASREFTVKSIHYIDDAGNLHKYIDEQDAGIETSFGCNYGCGIFEFVKN